MGECYRSATDVWAQIGHVGRVRERGVRGFQVEKGSGGLGGLLREESWAAGGAGAGPGCCCAGLFSLTQFLQTEMQEKAKEFGKELG